MKHSGRTIIPTPKELWNDAKLVLALYLIESADAIAPNNYDGHLLRRYIRAYQIRAEERDAQCLKWSMDASKQG